MEAKVDNDDSYLTIAKASGKKLLLFGSIYLIGYMNWSFLLVLAPVVIIEYLRKSEARLKRKRNIARVSDKYGEKEAILAHLTDLPAWVHFPDIERAEWLNQILKQVWPNVNQYARDLIAGPIEEAVKSSLQNSKLLGFKFDRIVLGTVPCRIGGIRVYENVSRDEIIMDIDLSYAGDCDITFHLMNAKGGIKNLQIYGCLRVVLKPLISSIPLFGGLQAFFLNCPDLDFDLTGLAAILEVPGIKQLLKSTITDTVSSIIVLPNKYSIQLSEEIRAHHLKAPTPQGVLRIHVVEARDLMKKDIGILGKGKSDPYAVLKIGAQEFRTKTIDQNVYPKWDEWCEFAILEPSGQKLMIKLWDYDTTGDDESLGVCSLDVADLMKAGQISKWITLDEAKKGALYLRAFWLDLSKNIDTLDQALIEAQELSVPTISTALLTVFIDSAENLPQPKAPKPDPFVELQLGKQKFETLVVMRSVNPVWEEGFTFFVNNPETEVLHLNIIDKKTDCLLGEINYKIKQLFEKEDLQVVNIPLRVLKSDGETNLIVTLQLRIFSSASSNFVQEHVEEKERKHSEISNSNGKPLLEKKDSSYSIVSNDSSSIFESTMRPEDADAISNFELPRPSISSNPGHYQMGRLFMTLRYSYPKQKLIIVVHKLANIPLKEIDKSHGPEVYIKLYLLPDHNKESKQKTKVKKYYSNMDFDDQFEYLLTESNISHTQLQVIVTANKLMKNEVLGEIFIELANLERLSQGHSGWFDLEPELE